MSRQRWGQVLLFPLCAELCSLRITSNLHKQRKTDFKMSSFEITRPEAWIVFPFFKVENFTKNHEADCRHSFMEFFTRRKFRKPWELSFFASPCGRARYHLWAVVEGMHVLRPLDPLWWVVTVDIAGWFCLGFLFKKQLYPNLSGNMSTYIIQCHCGHCGGSKLNFEVMETGKSIDGNAW